MTILNLMDLKKRRLELNMTQKELSVALAVTVTTVSRWEAGLCQLPPYVIPALASLKPLPKKEPRKGPHVIQQITEPFFTKILDVNGKTKASFNYDVDINALSYIDVIAENDTIVDGSLNPKATEQDFFVTLQILNYFKNNYLEYLKKLPTQPEQLNEIKN